MSFSELQSNVAKTIERLSPLDQSERVLVAWSGGADSTALAVVLSILGYDVILAHVDHGMRVGSAEDAEHCRTIAGHMGFPFVAKRVEVDPPTEAEGRKRRYEALEEMAQSSRADVIATGHTLDDQAETVALRLGRGGFGLGMAERRGKIVRPLLRLRRRDTEEICRLAGIAYLTDETNLDLRFARNRVRHELLPSLGESAVPLLAETGRRNRARIAALDAKLAGASERGIAVFVPGMAQLARDFLLDAPEDLRRHAIARAVEHVSGEPSGRLITDVEAKVLTRTGAKLDLPGGRAAWADRERVVFGDYGPPSPPPPFEVGVPGKAVSDDWGLEISVEETEPIAPARGGLEQVISGDAIPTGARLLVRSRKAGDRFRPLGAPGSKKLQDFFVDDGVPRLRRALVPIVEFRGTILWVVGMRIDEAFKLTPETRRALSLRVFPLLQQAGTDRSMTRPTVAGASTGRAR